jgi:hypothetical protein
MPKGEKKRTFMGQRWTIPIFILKVIKIKY